MESILRLIKTFLPTAVFARIQPAYHYLLALFAAARYGFPSRKLTVIGVTGTKGKSTTTELITAMLEADGRTTALASTIRFKIGQDSEPNLFKMTMPGRFVLQRFLRKAVHTGCTHAVLEMTSEGVKQYRHKHIALDTLVFTNLSPEHIESHGSFANYVAAKLKLARLLERSPKRPRTVVANADDEHGHKFLDARVEHALPYRLADALPYNIHDSGITFTFKGTEMHSPLAGEFNLSNLLAACTTAYAHGTSLEHIKEAAAATASIPGRVEHIDAGQPFSVIVDYAHTADSLQKVYSAFSNYRKVCVLGNTGGGRDRGKRPVMGAIAEEHCEQVILTNEDPYDEDPRAIVRDVEGGMRQKKPMIIMDRREAIRTALEKANGMNSENTAVLITGKGTDPYIMGPNGSKEPWSDARVAREELERMLSDK